MRYIISIFVFLFALSLQGQSGNVVGNCVGGGNPNLFYPDFDALDNCLVFIDTTNNPWRIFDYHGNNPIGFRWELRLIPDPEIETNITTQNIGQGIISLGIRKGIDPSTGMHLYVDDSFIYNYSHDVVNVKHFGAKGDGLTNDSQAIEDAIDFACNNNFAEVYMPKGVYRTSEAVTIDCNNMTLRGEAGTEINPISWVAGQGAIVVVNNGATMSNVQIENLVLNGFNYTGTARMDGIRMNFLNFGSIENVKISGIDDTGIWLDACNSILLKNNDITDALRAVDVDDSNNTIIEENIFSTTAFVQNTTADFIRLINDSKDTRINNNNLSGESNGILSSSLGGGSEKTSIINNRFFIGNFTGNSTKNAIYIQGVAGNDEGVEIRGGIITSNSGASIRIQGDVDDVIIKSISIDAEFRAIDVIGSNASYIHISDCIMDTERGLNFGTASNISIKGGSVRMNENAVSPQLGSAFCTNAEISDVQVTGGNIFIGANSIISGVNYFPVGNYDMNLNGGSIICTGNAIRDSRRIVINSNDNLVHDNGLYGGGTIVNGGSNNDIQDNKTF